MRLLKRLIYIILLNIVISAVTVLLVLNYWEKRNGSAPLAQALTPVVVVVTPTFFETPGTAVVAVPLAEAAQSSIENPPAPSETPPQSIATSTLEVIDYQVREGDTLGSIAVQFDVSVESIMALNDITDPNTVYLGQTLKIPTGELEPEASPTLAVPTATPSKTLPPPPTAVVSPTPGTPSAGGEVTVEIVSVIAAGDIENERVRISRSGEGELLLANWSLTDDDGNTYIFPQLYLYAGGAVDLHTKGGQNTVVDLYWGLAAAVWESGEQAILRDAQGEVRATYRVP
jgi:LysM repeat protein